MTSTLVSIAFSVGLAACGARAHDQPTTPAPADPTATGSADMAETDMALIKMKLGMVDPSADSKALLAKINDYASWPTFAENAEPKLSRAHRNMYVVTYHNEIVGAAIGTRASTLPDGAIIVKQNLVKLGEPPHALTIMSKQGGKWYWLEATPDGKVVTINDLPQQGFGAARCIKCHDDASSNDFVFTHNFAK